MQRRLLCVVFGIIFLTNSIFALPSSAVGETSDLSPAVAEAARILEVEQNVRSVLSLANQLNQGGDESVRRELLTQKSIILRKILLGYLEVRKVSDLIDVDLGYTYDAIEKESRKVDRLVNICNNLAFTQLGVQFSLAAGFRLKALTFPSNVLTNTSACGTIGLSWLGVLLSKSGRSWDKHPANALAGFFGLEPPEQFKLPGMIYRFINSPAPGSTKTRKEEAITKWKTRFGLDDSRKDKLGHLAAFPQKKHGESIGLLSKRLTLLYALNALIETFDDELLTLLRFLEGSSAEPIQMPESVTTRYMAELTPEAVEAANLLEIQPQVVELMDLRARYGSQISSVRQLRLEILILEKVLGGALEVRKVVDRIDEEKHYQYDVVLAQLLARRDSGLHMATCANFTQIGIVKNIAGGLFFNNEFKAGNTLIMNLNGVGTGLGLLALYLARGGKRKVDAYPNVLGTVFSLDCPVQYRVSPLISKYLNSVDPTVTGTMTRKERLIAHWKDDTFLKPSDKPKKFEVLSDMPSVQGQKLDTIGLVTSRLRMLFDVRAKVESLDCGLQDLLHACDKSPNSPPGYEQTLASIEKRTQEFKALRSGGSYGNSSEQELELRIVLLRKILGAALEVRKTTDLLDYELANEYTVQGAMIANRNRTVEINNSINFLQSGILGLIAGGISYAGANNASNDINIISGSLNLLLTALAAVEARGGKRPGKAKPNMLVQMLDLKPPNERLYSYLVWDYLNTSPAGAQSGMTRRQLLLEHWKKSGVLTINLKDRKNFDKLAAYGPAHKDRSETIKLVTNRLKMMHDVHTEVETIDQHLVSALHEMD